jgi:hypothetical protein
MCAEQPLHFLVENCTVFGLQFQAWMPIALSMGFAAILGAWSGSPE